MGLYHLQCLCGSMPVNINPLEIITEMRRYIVMEESQAPASLNNMFGNMENNGAPWKYSNADRLTGKMLIVNGSQIIATATN
jgi:Fe-S oxidoreductase